MDSHRLHSKKLLCDPMSRQSRLSAATMASLELEEITVELVQAFPKSITNSPKP